MWCLTNFIPVFSCCFANGLDDVMFLLTCARRIYWTIEKLLNFDCCMVSLLNVAMNFREFHKKARIMLEAAQHKEQRNFAEDSIDGGCIFRLQRYSWRSFVVSRLTNKSLHNNWLQEEDFLAIQQFATLHCTHDREEIEGDCIQDISKFSRKFLPFISISLRRMRRCMYGRSAEKEFQSNLN